MIRLAFALLFAATLFACAQAAPPTPTTVPTTAAPAKSGTLRYYQLLNPDLRDVPMDLALKQLAAQGYTIQTQQLENSTLLAEALSRGDADIAQFNNQTAWNAVLQGAKLRTIAVPVAGTGIIAARNTITDCAQLEGKPLALPVNTGINPTLLNKYLAEKCGGAKPQIIILPDIKARFAGLQNGSLDASLMQRDDLFELEQQAPGKFSRLIALNQSFPNVIVNGLHVNTDFAQANPQLIYDLLYALVVANRQVVSNPSLAIEEGVNRLQLDRAFAEKAVTGNIADKLWDQNGGLTTEKVQQTLDFLISLKILAQSITPEQVSDVSYLNRVLDELGRK